jgi:hypothetical protein
MQPVLSRAARIAGIPSVSPGQHGHNLSPVGIDHEVNDPGRLEFASLIRLGPCTAVQRHGHVFKDVDQAPPRSGVARGQFPAADAVVGSTKLWRRTTVQSWAAQRPRKGAPST